MPNIMIHEEVGSFISKRIHINSYEFFLGLLAPDSVNYNGFAEKEIRWTSHQRKKDLQEWKDYLNNFYIREKNNYPKDFIIGYYIHILTDIIYDEFLYAKVKEKILKDNFKQEEAHEIMGQDMNKYYFPEIEEIKEILKSNNNSYDILNINKDLLLKWKEKQINNFNNKNSSKYITEDIITILNEEVLKNVKICLKKEMICVKI